MVECDVTYCPSEATVLVVRDRPATTPTRDADEPCWTGHMEAKRCAPHAVDEVNVFVPVGTRGLDWQFMGDVVTFRPLP